MTEKIVWKEIMRYIVIVVVVVFSNVDFFQRWEGWMTEKIVWKEMMRYIVIVVVVVVFSMLMLLLFTERGKAG